jgi:hypothetical protein
MGSNHIHKASNGISNSRVEQCVEICAPAAKKEVTVAIETIITNKYRENNERALGP